MDTEIGKEKKEKKKKNIIKFKIQNKKYKVQN